MLGRVARLHYQHGLTHQQIADTLGLSRVKVTRLLAEARRTGVVEIRIHSDETVFTDLEFEVQAAYGLAQVWIAPTFDEPDRLLASIGTVGAHALQAAVRPGMTVRGVSLYRERAPLLHTLRFTDAADKARYQQAFEQLREAR